MSKHTPGPWELISGVFVSEPRLLKSIADVSFDELPHSQCTANALLIAAAPDLLEALIAIEAAYSQVTNWEYAGSTDRNPELARPVAIAARAAIARAKG